MDIFKEKKFYPDYEEPILSHFKDFYNSAFAAFLPFFNLENNQIENPSVQKSQQISYEQLKSEMKEFANIPEFKAKIFSYENEDYPDEKTIVENGEIRTWKQIKEEAKFNDFSEINKALRTSIGSLLQDFERVDLAEKLNSYTNAQKIFHPVEGNFSPLVKIKIYNSLKQADKNEIVVVEEFSEIEREINLASITVEEFVEKVKSQDYYIYAKDKSVLFTIDWDSFFFLICSNQLLLNEIIEAGNFEGFFCTETTVHNWDFEKAGIES